MILPDANLLLYAYDAGSPFHAKSAAWWSKCLSGSEPVGFCPAVLFAFIRIGTSARAFIHPMTIQEASTHVQDWLEQPVTQLLPIELQDVRQALMLLVDAGTGGNLTTDAQIAAVSLRLGAIIHTVDTDYARFPQVRWFNPLTGKHQK
ncbi:MAG: PIN domain-containing protein [Methylacidiphilales bacterium]|nr:PIN domain-containing protein [Candidatus Methylacidiphilales bacterium]